MTAAERREANRLRSERWRRAHGIMPRRPAQKPWLAEGAAGQHGISGAIASALPSLMASNRLASLPQLI